MSKKAKYTFLGTVLALTICVASLAIVQIIAAESATVSTLSEIPNKNQGYLIRACGGYVGVYYSNDEDYPAIITEIPTENLRSYDRQLIETGLSVESREELMQILEDLGS